MLWMLVIKVRVDALEKNGIEATILAFKRDYYLGKSFDNNYILLGNISRGTSAKNFTTRIPLFFRCYVGVDTV